MSLRPSARGRLAFLILAIAVGALSLGVLNASGDPERPASASAGAGAGAGAGDEVVLDARVAERARRDRDVPERASAPRPREPGALSPQASGEKLPPRILRENAKLRRDLEDLKALEAANRRVERALGAAGTFDGPLRVGSGGLAWPVGGPLVSPFGQRWGRLHAGIDIASPAGTPIRAAAGGQVVLSGPTGGYGNYVCVAHDRSLTTCYAHMSQILTEQGAVVAQGQVLGLVGCTGHCFGDHLHFETRFENQPVDPLPYLR